MSHNGFLARLFSRLMLGTAWSQRDGEAHMLEAHATGLAPALLDAATLPEPKAISSGGRRRRALTAPNQVVQEALSQKVLHGWLQNRHQTLYPLTINFRLLHARHAELLVRIMAAVMLAGAAPPDETRIGACLSWLRQVGGCNELEVTLRRTIQEPEPLSTLLREVHQAGMTAYAYVVSLIAADPREDAAQIFLDYLAMRLNLPANVVRSADRRYRNGQAAVFSVSSESAL